MAEYIDKQAAIEQIKAEWAKLPLSETTGFAILMRVLASIPAADVQPVVLCRDCKYYVPSGEADVERMCVRGAEWCAEVGCYYGFTDYTRPDYFCADGEKREES